MKVTDENKGQNRLSDRFHLTKWYLDGVDKMGCCIIAYAAKMHWNGLSVPYNSLLISEPEKKVINKSRFRRLSWPDCKGSIITWEDSDFGVSGVWEQKGYVLKARLFESSEGFLDWCCFQTKSISSIKTKNEVICNGYVERLVLTIEPWKIPIKQLLWGRFHSDVEDIVWIDITGDMSKQWVWYNGQAIFNSHLDDEYIVIPELKIKLKFEQCRILERGNKIYSVVKSLLSFVPGFNKIIPGTFLNAKETKWLCRGSLTCNGNIKRKGWVIHELVEFDY